jgi:hypothetical protein
LSGHKGYELPVSFRLTRLGLGCDLTTPRLAIAVRLLI